MRLLSTSSRLNSWLAHQPAVSLREAFLITKWAPLTAPPPTPTLRLPSISAKAQRQLLGFDPVFLGCRDGSQPGFWVRWITGWKNLRWKGCDQRGRRRTRQIFWVQLWKRFWRFADEERIIKRDYNIVHSFCVLFLVVLAICLHLSRLNYRGDVDWSKKLRFAFCRPEIRSAVISFLQLRQFQSRCKTEGVSTNLHLLWYHYCPTPVKKKSEHHFSKFVFGCTTKKTNTLENCNLKDAFAWQCKLI